MNIFISGGCKNGKSTYAQRRAKEIADIENRNLYYVATMIPKDREDIDRVNRHLKEREGWGFETIEVAYDLGPLTSKIDENGVYLFDSVTAFLENNMFDENYNLDENACDRCTNQLLKLAETKSTVLFVSDYIYSDAITYNDTTEIYRKSLAKIDRSLAAICDQVIEVVYANVKEHKKL